MARQSAARSESPGQHTTTPFHQQEAKKMPSTSSSRSAYSKSPVDDDPDEASAPFDATLLPNGTRDLSLIGLQAFFLGTTLASGMLMTIYFLSIHSAWWRMPTFVVCLSLFHFLEYYTTARYNAPVVKASSFLLFNNGSAYAAAHTLATVEIVVSNFFPTYQSALNFHPWTVAAGLILVIVGQTVRSIAMKQAGTNFNHIVAIERKESHVLVTRGMYAVLRHPSYFGFFWWAIGTQVLVGNKVCLVGYSFALWNFFYTRTRMEEKILVRFFGAQYEEYRKRTGTLIPFVP